MRLSAKGILRGLILGGTASLIAACGGGGGGGGGGGNFTPVNEYQISLRADRTSLPLNIAGEGPGIGVDAAYTTTLYVTARRSGTNDPIPGGEDVFACNVVPAGLEQGALYYLDGDEEHEVDIEVNGETVSVPAAFRSVTLGSNAGGASFHFHAGNTAGTATVTCSVLDPQDNRNKTTSIQIVVGQASGKASQVRVNTSAPNFLFAQNTNGTTQLQVQAQVLDEAGQRVTDPAAGVRNVYANIVGTASPADDDAVLRSASDGGSRSWVLARTINGQADFTLVSGINSGTILVEVLADRFDNNVDNGITEPVRNMFAVPVAISVSQQALAVVTATALPDAEEEKSYATILTATGGVPPYRWERITGSVLPTGLNLASDGVITGTPIVDGTFRFALKVTDSSTIPQTASKEFSIRITPAPEPEPVPTSPAVATGTLPAGTVGVPYIALLTASGGTPPYIWSAVSLPAGLAINADGVLSGTPVAAGTFSVAFTVRDADGLVANRIVNLTINP